MWRISLVLLFSLVVVPAYSNPPTPPKAGHQPEIGTTQHDETAAKDQRGSETSPLFIKVIPPLAVEPGPAKEAENGHDNSSAEWWLVYITGALVLATCGLIIYTARLWGATKSLAEDAEKTAARQAREMQASLLIAQESADAAKKSAEAAERTVSTMRDTAEKQLRAYVMVDCVEIVDVKPDPSREFVEPWIHVRYKNFGQIPATGCKYWFVIDIAECPLKTPLVGNKVVQLTGPIPPHDTFTAKIKLPLMNSPNEHAALYVYGEIHYFDGFVADRTTKMFFMRGGGDDWMREGELHICQEGNSVT